LVTETAGSQGGVARIEAADVIASNRLVTALALRLVSWGSADEDGRTAAMERIALLDGAAVLVVKASDVLVDAACVRDAGVIGASVVVVAERSGDGLIDTSNGGVARVDRASVAVVAISRGPRALLIFATLNGACVTVVAVISSGTSQAFPTTGANALVLGRDTTASGLRALPRDAARNASGASDVVRYACVGRRVAGGVGAVRRGNALLGRFLAASAAESVISAGSYLLASVGGMADTTTAAEATAGAARGLVNLAGEADDIKETISEFVEIGEGQDAVPVVLGKDEKISHRDLRIEVTDTNSEGDKARDGLVGVVDRPLKIVRAVVRLVSILALARLVGAVVVVIAIGNDEKELFNTGAGVLSDELVSAFNHTRANRGTAAAALVITLVEGAFTAL